MSTKLQWNEWFSNFNFVTSIFGFSGLSRHRLNIEHKVQLINLIQLNRTFHHVFRSLIVCTTDLITCTNLRKDLIRKYIDDDSSFYKYSKKDHCNVVKLLLLNLKKYCSIDDNQNKKVDNDDRFITLTDEIKEAWNNSLKFFTTHAMTLYFWNRSLLLVPFCDEKFNKMTENDAHGIYQNNLIEELLMPHLIVLKICLNLGYINEQDPNPSLDNSDAWRLSIDLRSLEIRTINLKDESDEIREPIFHRYMLPSTVANFSLKGFRRSLPKFEFSNGIKKLEKINIDRYNGMMGMPLNVIYIDTSESSIRLSNENVSHMFCMCTEFSNTDLDISNFRPIFDESGEIQTPGFVIQWCSFRNLVLPNNFEWNERSDLNKVVKYLLDTNTFMKPSHDILNLIGTIQRERIERYRI